MTLFKNRFSHCPRSMEWLALALLMLAGAYARLAGLDAYAFSSDEVWHLAVADQPTLREAFFYNLKTDVHPPLMFLLLHAMLAISDNELFLRSISLLPGILLIPVSYFTTKKIMNGGVFAAFIVAGIMSLSPLMVILSQPVRAYALMVLALWCALWALYWYVDTLRQRYLWGYFFAGLVAVLSSASGLLFIAALGATGLYKLIAAAKNPPWRRMLLWSAIHAALLLLILIHTYLLQVIGGYSPTDSSQGMDMSIVPILISALLYVQPIPVFLLGAVIVLCALSVWGLWRHKRMDLLVCLSATIALSLIANSLHAYPFVYPRHHLFFILPISLLLAGGCHYLAKKRGQQIKAILLILIMGASALSYPLVSDYRRSVGLGSMEFSLTKDELQRAFSTFDAVVGPNDPVVVPQVTAWYLRYLGKNYQDFSYGQNIYSTLWKGRKAFFYMEDYRTGAEKTSMCRNQLIARELLTTMPPDASQKIWFMGLGFIKLQPGADALYLPVKKRPAKPKLLHDANDEKRLKQWKQQLALYRFSEQYFASVNSENRNFETHRDKGWYLVGLTRAELEKTILQFPCND